MKKMGILLDPSNGDLMVKDGSLQLGNTLYQNQYLILKAQKGELKEHPAMGVGIDDLAGDNDTAEWKRLIREEFAKDGLKISQLEISDGMVLKADY